VSRLTCNRAYIDHVVTRTSPGAEFQAAFWEAKHALAVASSAAFAGHGVHNGQQHVLRCLWDEDGLSPGEVAGRLGIATSTVTRTAQRLEAAGLLQRRSHPTDGRLVRLVLTATGRDLEAAIRRELRKLTRRALAGFTPEEQSALVDALDRVRQNLIG
jgi:DNA-binding MarR family transcriptional regulator